MLFPGNSRWNPYLTGGERQSSNEMTVRRSRFSSVPPGYFASTKGHSALRRSYYPPSRAAVYAEDIYYPELHRIRPYDTTREENDIRREVNSELIYTSNLLDDTYDVAARSRNRDQSLLRDATQAVPSSNKPADRKTSASLTPARRFQSTRSTTIPPSILPRTPTAYPRLTPPMYKATTNVQPLGILTKLDWTSPLRKYAIPGRLQDNDDNSEISPYTTPTQSARSSPERDINSRPRRYKGRLGPRRKVSNYYKRLVNRRAGRPSATAKYYPYLDDESIDSEDGGEVLSNGETYDENEYQSNVGDDYYYIERERSTSPVEYIPFGPRSRIDFSSGEYDCQVPSLPDLAMSPYITDKDKTIDSERSQITDDLLFHNVVARTASKARDALKNVDLDEYDNASLVISVEGEYKDPVRGENMGFHYIARPLTLKGPMLAGPAVYASTASDSAFSRYMDDMRAFRAEIRNRLETGYKTLSEVSSKYPTHSYPILASSYRSYSPRAVSQQRGTAAILCSSSPTRGDVTETLPISNLRRRLEEIESRCRRSGYGKRLEDEFSGDRLVVYPVSEKGSIAAVTGTENLPGHTKTVDLYQATAKGNELSTFEKINIKAALVGNKVEVTTPHRRRPRSTYAANKMRELKRDEREREVEAVPTQITSSLKASTVTSVRY